MYENMNFSNSPVPNACWKWREAYRAYMVERGKQYPREMVTLKLYTARRDVYMLLHRYCRYEFDAAQIDAAMELVYGYMNEPHDAEYKVAVESLTRLEYYISAKEY